jgi:hypothetical protein
VAHHAKGYDARSLFGYARTAHTRDYVVYYPLTALMAHLSVHAVLDVTIPAHYYLRIAHVRSMTQCKGYARLILYYYLLDKGGCM